LYWYDLGSIKVAPTPLMDSHFGQHLANSRSPRDITSAGISVSTLHAHPQFTSYFTTGTDRMPMSRQTQSDDATAV